MRRRLCSELMMKGKESQWARNEAKLSTVVVSFWNLNQASMIASFSFLISTHFTQASSKSTTCASQLFSASPPKTLMVLISRLILMSMVTMMGLMKLMNLMVLRMFKFLKRQELLKRIQFCQMCSEILFKSVNLSKIRLKRKKTL